MTRRRKHLRAVSFRGLVKSVYYSIKHANSLRKISIGKNTSFLISDDAKFELEGRLLVGSDTPYAVNPFGDSFFHVSNDGLIRTTGERSRIGAGSAVNIRGVFEMGNSYISGDSRIYVVEKVSIGDGCAISWDVNILDSNGEHNLKIDGERRSESAPIRIEDGVWVGHHSTIQKGVEIGEGAIVASHSLVNNDVPSNSLVAGVPAEIISEDVEWWG